MGAALTASLPLPPAGTSPVTLLADASPSPSPSSLNLTGDPAGQSVWSDQNWALRYVVLAGVLALIWFTIRALARRDVRWAGTIYARLDPQVQALTGYLRGAPATVIYTACWTATTMVVQGSPPALVEALTRVNSTNIVGIVVDPIKALLVSGLLVAEHGLGFILYVAVYVLIVARLEQRIGSPRTIMIWLIAHCGGSLLTIGCEVLLIKFNAAPVKLALTADVGVSYVMVGSLGAYCLWISRKWRPWYLVALLAGIGLPVIFDATLWDFGHLCATLLGFVAGGLAWWMGPTRPPVRWRTLAAVPPRTLSPPELAKVGGGRG